MSEDAELSQSRNFRTPYALVVPVAWVPLESPSVPAGVAVPFMFAAWVVPGIAAPGACWLCCLTAVVLSVLVE